MYCAAAAVTAKLAMTIPLTSPCPQPTHLPAPPRPPAPPLLLCSGRAYPLHPHLHHLGDDATRGLLQFGRGRPLGERGFDWLLMQVGGRSMGGAWEGLGGTGMSGSRERRRSGLHLCPARPLRLVYAPHRYWRRGGVEAWRRGGVEAWRRGGARAQRRHTHAHTLTCSPVCLCVCVCRLPTCGARVWTSGHWRSGWSGRGSSCRRCGRRRRTRWRGAAHGGSARRSRGR